MYSKFRLGQKYLNYYLSASSGKGHGIHSPFVYEFIREVLLDDRNFPAYFSVENLRKQLLRDRTRLTLKDYGAGSTQAETKCLTVAEIARRAAKPKKYGQLIYRVANHYKPKMMIELGSSLGLSTAYLSLANPASLVYTLEGSELIANYAENNFRKLALSNIRLVTGSFDDTLSGTLKKSGNIELAFIDGNHRENPTLAYFNQLLSHRAENAVFIFDDIHWSPGMERAWSRIKKDPGVLLTVDLFMLGLVFFNKDFKYKQDFTIRF